MLGCKSRRSCKSTYLTALSRFADHDHFMRFCGGGVGHKATRTATKLFNNDRDKLDFERRQARARSEDVDDEIEPDEEPNEVSEEDRDSESPEECEDDLDDGSLDGGDKGGEDGDDSEEGFEDDEFGPEDEVSY